MINRFAIRLTHTAPIYNQNPSFPEIINGKNPAQSRSPRKESYSSWHFGFPHTSPWERVMHWLDQSRIVRANLKTLSTSWPPAQGI
jgi:hypothetical protein